MRVAYAWRACSAPNSPDALPFRLRALEYSAVYAWPKEEYVCYVFIRHWHRSCGFARGLHNH